MISEKDVAAAGAASRDLSGTRLSCGFRPRPGPRLYRDTEARTAAACRKFQAARGIQPFVVGHPACGRRDCRVGRQPRRGGSVCRACFGRPSGNLRPGCHSGDEFDRITSYGARIVQTGATYAEALAASRERQTETGALEVHAWDDPGMLAGQVTVGREFNTMRLSFACAGGTAGVADGRGRRVVCGRCAGCQCRARGLSRAARCAAGRASDRGSGRWRGSGQLGARQVGALMFPIAQAYVAAAVLVPDAAIVAAQRLIWDRLRLIAEPGGATALAALLCGSFKPPEGARVGVVVCSANTDPAKVVGS